MAKNTVTGSFLARMFPTMAKHFLENASQDEVNKAEQEAAVIHQQLNTLGETTETVTAAETTTVGSVAAVVAPEGTEAPGATDLAAMTTRATTAEQKVTALENQVKTLQSERDQYKAWYDKQAKAGTKLPAADATTRNTAAGDEPALSAATSSALEQFRKRRA
ncbi:hypothetical protein F5984_19820 [Rudanella paleaurantiibacter]|uniref:Uncharacterized protein n=1 Tax=Rudanella paleaurantiibacter TaxID=2614655 RepID=A0A7J5TV31_9BACT|nr:hypothetical protein [Rudanella paleaurantiibacter]KAB7728005.1 hypothetical protein F5984_19820 [Rudanella paleaurantiibacter]